MLLYSAGQIYEKELNYNNNSNLLDFFKFLESETIDIWKSMNAIQNVNPNYINCKIKYYNLMELKEIRNKLNSVSLIDEINVKSMSYKNIEYNIHFYGNFKILVKIFEYNQLKINNDQELCTIKLK